MVKKEIGFIYFVFWCIAFGRGRPTRVEKDIAVIRKERRDHQDRIESGSNNYWRDSRQHW